MSEMQSWSPFDELRRLESEVSDLFRSFQEQKGTKGTYPLPLNVKETDDEYLIEAQLPGFDSDEIDIEVTAQYFDISAERSEEETEDDDSWILREIKDIKYRRRINLNTPINTDQAETTLKNGLLKVKLPKSEMAKPKKLTPETA